MSIQLHRAFWIKLGRLATMLEKLNESRAFLETYRRSGEWTNLSPNAQQELARLHELLDDLAGFD